jgi:hypothetical protein
MNWIVRFTREASFSTGAKAIAIVFIVGMIALFTTHSSLPTGEAALVPATVVVQHPATTVATVAARTDSANHASAPATKL